MMKKALLFIAVVCVLAAGVSACGESGTEAISTPYPNDPNTYPAGRISLEIASVKFPHETIVVAQNMSTSIDKKNVSMSYYISQAEGKNDFYLASTALFDEDVFTLMSDDDFSYVVENMLLQMLDEELTNIQVSKLSQKDLRGKTYKAIQVICDSGTHPIIVHSYGIKDTFIMVLGASQTDIEPKKLKGVLDTIKFNS